MSILTDKEFDMRNKNAKRGAETAGIDSVNREVKFHILLHLSYQPISLELYVELDLNNSMF